MERKVPKSEKVKRGCNYCAEARRGEHGSICPHDECPYTVLDKHETYEDYMKSEDSKIDITALADMERNESFLAEMPRDRLKSLRRLGKGSLF